MNRIGIIYSNSYTVLQSRVFSMQQDLLLMLL